MLNWDSFVKTYDVRGLVGSELTPEVVRSFGAGFADELALSGKYLIIGHDMRDSSPTFAQAFAEGAMARGANVKMLGLCSTDMTYFASGNLDLPAVMFTASHNPASYNGIKFSRAGARGISLQTGMSAIRDRAMQYFESGISASASKGSMESLNLMADYAGYLRALVDLTNIRPLKIVVDTANGMGGLTVPAVLQDAAGLGALPIEIVPLYFELDGNFPNHEANPLDSKNLVDLQKAILEHGADLGLAFDGDADRCFAVDEKGQAVSPSAIAAIVSKREIQRARNSGVKDIKVIHNLLTSRFVAETIAESGATPVRTKVGHSLIKDEMAASAAIFGGEHSAHYYFANFWGADNGMLAALHIISELGSNNLLMSQLSRANNPYFQSGEINSEVADSGAALGRLRSTFPEASVEAFDGHTFSGVDGSNWWWLNVRPSNTEPLLRLNVESISESTMQTIRDLAIRAIRN